MNINTTYTKIITDEDLMEAVFTVNYEPRYISGNYEGCFLCEDGNVIKICCRKQKE